MDSPELEKRVAALEEMVAVLMRERNEDQEQWADFFNGVESDAHKAARLKEAE